MARFCSSCGQQIADAATFCAACGARVGVQSVGGGAAAVAAPARSSGLASNVAGMLAYITIIPAIIFLVLEPYNKDKFVRFHAFQSILLTGVYIVAQIVLLMVPIVGWAIAILVDLAAFVAWIMLLVKAYGNQKTKLPVLGDYAEKFANQ